MRKRVVDAKKPENEEIVKKQRKEQKPIFRLIPLGINNIFKYWYILYISFFVTFFL